MAASASTTSFASDPLRWGRLLAPAGDAHYAVNNYVGNARQIAFSKRIERIFGYRSGDFVQQHKVGRPAFFQYSQVQAVRAPNVARRHADGFLRLDFADRREKSNLTQYASRHDARSARSVGSNQHTMMQTFRLDRSGKTERQAIISRRAYLHEKFSLAGNA